MTTSIKAQIREDGHLIRISAPLNSRIKLLEFIYALMFFTGGVGFCKLLLMSWSENLGASIIAVLMVLACSVAFFRFVNKATESEKLFVNKERLDIIYSSLLKVEKHSYDTREISHFVFLEKEKYEPHPLKGETFDYLGFQTEQQVIQDLHSEGRVSFVYNGRQVRFGKELTSWDFSELEVLLYDITGNDFRYIDKYEQEKFPKS